MMLTKKQKIELVNLWHELVKEYHEMRIARHALQIEKSRLKKVQRLAHYD